MRIKGKATWMIGATAALSLVTFAASPAKDVILVTPVSVSASSFNWSDRRDPNTSDPPQRMIDGSGLTGTGRTAVHTCVYYSRTWWYSQGGSRVASQWVEFDLGAAYTISNALVWQLAAARLGTRGVREFTIKVAGPEKVFSTLSTGNVLNQATCPDEEPVQVVPLAATNVRHVRFEIQSNWGAPNIVGLSEVRFEGFLAR